LALKGVSVRVEPGEIVAVVGPSGSGKSTLLACLAGIDEPAGGTVHVAGQRVTHKPEAHRARIRAQFIGVLLQSRNLIGHLTVAQNVSLARTASPRRSTKDVLDSVGLTRRRDALPHQLSGGELARAGLAVALANDPSVLLADEPTGELDGATEQQILSLLHAHAAGGTAVLVLTHSTAVTSAADRTLYLTDGTLT
ncbi:MAG TPA: ATP-binding cassette domain-containing protein, partial [Pedococcus sp.]|nr:ATP-binding cassette domain-containing protein [Pedococcus sp.]